jgi:hypothetical protein
MASRLLLETISLTSRDPSLLFKNAHLRGGSPHLQCHGVSFAAHLIALRFEYPYFRK